ncbi:MAG: hypothetical protein AAF658_18895, partial [Myxococcota bacterium]
MSASTEPPRTAFSVLRGDIDRCEVPLNSADWEEFTAQCTEVRYAKGEVVFDVGAVPEGLLFVTGGVAAAELLLPDGRCIIHRFFEPGQVCTTITAAWYGTETADSIGAVGGVEGILIPWALWKDTYL